MQRLSKSIFFLFASSFLTACGGFYDYDSTVDGRYRALIEEDMGRISESKMVSQNAEDLKTLSIANLSGQALTTWLQQRNRIVVGEDYDWMGGNFVTSQTASQPPQLLTTAETSLLSGVSAGGTTTVMVNLGAAIYLSGVEKGVVYTVQAAGKDVRVWSPRAAGIIQVGEGLFRQMITSSPLDSYAHSVRRGSTYLHEATHTDGNGQHRAFAHATCPANYYRTEFQNEYACEGYLNGPYARQVVYLRYAIPQACAQNGCSSAEQDALLTTLADYNSRKLSTAYYADPTPEGYSVSSLGEISVTPKLSEMMSR